MNLTVMLVLVVTVAGSVAAAIAIHDARERQIGASLKQVEIVQRSEVVGAQNAAKAKKAIARAHVPGSLDRLRADPATCPDCRRGPAEH